MKRQFSQHRRKSFSSPCISRPGVCGWSPSKASDLNFFKLIPAPLISCILRKSRRPGFCCGWDFRELVNAGAPGIRPCVQGTYNRIITAGNLSAGVQSYSTENIPKPSNLMYTRYEPPHSGWANLDPTDCSYVIAKDHRSPSGRSPLYVMKKVHHNVSQLRRHKPQICTFWYLGAPPNRLVNVRSIRCAAQPIGQFSVDFGAAS